MLYLYLHFWIVGKLYRIVVLHNETNEEPYKIVNVIVSNTFNLKSNECISASGTYHVVMTKTRNPSVEDQQKISEDLENLGINGLKLTDLSGWRTIWLNTYYVTYTITYILFLTCKKTKIIIQCTNGVLQKCKKDQFF